MKPANCAKVRRHQSAIFDGNLGRKEG